MADKTTENTMTAEDTNTHIESNVDDTELNGDIVEGSALGLVGGAIVGGLAGGPIGAVIGAVVGGIASAFGVAEVDRHDHDAHDTPTDGVSLEPAAIENTSIPPVVEAVPQEEAELAPSSVVVPATPISGIYDAPIDVEDHSSSRSYNIRLRAYELYELRGREDGKALQDWLNAEREYESVAA